MRLVIIESPYVGEVARNLNYLRAAMRDCLFRGEAPMASHGLYTQSGVLDDNSPGDRDLGIEAGFHWRRVAQATVVYADLGWSHGMEVGVLDSEENGIPVEVRYLPNWRYDGR